MARSSRTNAPHQPGPRRKELVVVGGAAFGGFRRSYQRIDHRWTNAWGYCQPAICRLCSMMNTTLRKYDVRCRRETCTCEQAFHCVSILRSGARQRRLARTHSHRMCANPGFRRRTARGLGVLDAQNIRDEVMCTVTSVWRMPLRLRVVADDQHPSRGVCPAVLVPMKKAPPRWFRLWSRSYRRAVIEWASNGAARPPSSIWGRSRCAMSSNNAVRARSPSAAMSAATGEAANCPARN